MPEAEEMISLSNSVHKRVIQIKTAEFFAEKQLNTDASAEETLDGLMEKIADAKAKLEEIKQEQYRIIEEGKARIIEEKQQWQEEKIRLVEEAKKEGYQAGFQLGKEESRKEYERLLTQANEIVEKSTSRLLPYRCKARRYDFTPGNRDSRENFKKETFRRSCSFSAARSICVKRDAGAGSSENLRPPVEV